MKLLQPCLLAPFLLCCCLSGSQANRIYIHPFTLFANKNQSCVTLQDETLDPLQTLPVAPLDIDILTPDSRDTSKQDAREKNITERMLVLVRPLNHVGLRMYQALSKKQHSSNTLFSPVNAYGSLITLYLGASRRTASYFQLFLGISSGTDPDDCVSLVDGHKILKTLQNINYLVDDGPKDQITTQVWTFIRHDALLSKDFFQGTQDSSDTSFVHSVDFSQPQEAEQLVNNFLEKTSDGKVKSIFKDLNSSTDFLFLSSVSFKDNWQTAFQLDKTSLQEFHVDETTTVKAPLMTHTGLYYYLSDAASRCTVVKLPLSTQSYMLLVLPDQGSKLHTLESKLLYDVLSNWHQNLQEGLLELSIPKFSMSSVTDLQDLLMAVSPEIEVKLLGSEAKFTQLSNINPFTINKAINKVTFEISEGPELHDKTELTGIPLKMTINRPFFFSVIEEGSDAILMLGKIMNPTL
ncbi:angiotensinogen [Brachionichthys hirsutus]|uniref:angiotensinogen n=1 Tax=Brachionichthys hirsutus TaxID=412623 RepID=UPI003604EBDF